jgi:hypothetical protein
MGSDSDRPDIRGARHRAARYDDAGLLGTASMRLNRQAPGAGQRELLRRDEIRIEGRISEDVAHAVHASTPIWNLLVEKGLPEDVSVRELNAIRDCLLGRQVPYASTVADVSLKFNDPSRVAALAGVIPGDLEPHEVTAYRYATVTGEGDGVEEPFIIALREGAGGTNEVLAAMLVRAMFLRYEQELGVLDNPALETLAGAAATDLQIIADTHRALSDA